MPFNKSITLQEPTTQTVCDKMEETEMVVKTSYSLTSARISAYIKEIMGHTLYTIPITNSSEIFIKDMPSQYMIFSFEKERKREYLSEYTGKQLVNFYPQIVNAICFLRENGILHANIQPCNIIVCNNITCKITNFEHSLLLRDEMPSQLKYLPDNYLWSSQMHLLCYMVDKDIEILSEHDIKKVLKENTTTTKYTTMKMLIEWCLEYGDLYSLHIVYSLLLKENKEWKDKLFLAASSLLGSTDSLLPLSLA